MAREFMPPHTAYRKMLEALERMRTAREYVEYNAKYHLPLAQVQAEYAKRESEYKEAAATWERVQEWVRKEEWYQAMQDDIRE